MRRSVVLRGLVAHSPRVGTIDDIAFRSAGSRGCSNSDFNLCRTTCCEAWCVTDEELHDLYIDGGDLSKVVAMIGESAAACPLCGARDWDHRDVEELKGVPDTWRWALSVATRRVDGGNFDDFDGFCAEFSRSVLGGDYEWHGNLDALNDILRGGFGTPSAPWNLRWVRTARSRDVLGWPATRRWLAAKMQTCHPANVESLRRLLAEADAEHGETLFDMIVAIIRDHGPGGAEHEDSVLLELTE